MSITKTPDIGLLTKLYLEKDFITKMRELPVFTGLAGGKIRFIPGFNYKNIIAQMEVLGDGKVAEGELIPSYKVNLLEENYEIGMTKYSTAITAETLIKIREHAPEAWTAIMQEFSSRVGQKLTEDLKNALTQLLMVDGFYKDPRDGILTLEELKQNKLFIDESGSTEPIEKLIFKYMIKSRTIMANRVNSVPSNGKYTIVLPIGALDNYLIEKLQQLPTSIYGLNYLKFDANIDIVFLNCNPLVYTQGGTQKYLKNYMMVFEGTPFEIIATKVYDSLIPGEDSKIDGLGLIGTKQKYDDDHDILKIFVKYAIGCRLVNNNPPLVVVFPTGANK